MARALNKQYIGPIPGMIKNSDDTKTDIFTVLGLTPSAVTKTTYNPNGEQPPLATVEIDGIEYDLLPILQEVARAALATIEKTGYGIHSGLAVTQQDTPDMTVAISSGIRYLADGTRQAVSADAALDVDTADGTYNRKDLIYVDADGEIQYIAGDIAVAGERDITIDTAAATGDTFVLGGETFTAVASGASTDEFVPGGTAAADALSIIDLINANVTLSALFTASTGGDGIINLIEDAPGGGDTPGEATVTGTIVATNGDATESVDTGDTLPATPTGGISIASLNVDASTVAIETAMITGTRVWTTPGVND